MAWGKEKNPEELLGFLGIRTLVSPGCPTDLGGKAGHVCPLRDLLVDWLSGTVTSPCVDARQQRVPLRRVRATC